MGDYPLFREENFKKGISLINKLIATYLYLF